MAAFLDSLESYRSQGKTGTHALYLESAAGQSDEQRETLCEESVQVYTIDILYR